MKKHGSAITSGNIIFFRYSGDCLFKNQSDLGNLKPQVYARLPDKSKPKSRLRSFKKDLCLYYESIKIPEVVIGLTERGLSTNVPGYLSTDI